jgi:hypothetical protein
MSLKSAPRLYLSYFQESGIINFVRLDRLRSLIAALKVLVEAMVLMEREVEMEMVIEAPWDEGTTWHWKEQILLYAEQIRADVEETEAILAGYWEGVLAETRRASGATGGRRRVRLQNGSSRSARRNRRRRRSRCRRRLQPQRSG